VRKQIQAVVIITAGFREAGLVQQGPCEIHRRSFAPIAGCLQGTASWPAARGAKLDNSLMTKVT